jgi:hypothetical protein
VQTELRRKKSEENNLLYGTEFTEMADLTSTIHRFQVEK